MVTQFIWGTGRRKSAIARVRVSPGTGIVMVNDRPVEKFFPNPMDRLAALEPLTASQRVDKYDVRVTVSGSGTSGQAGAVRLGLARALFKAEEELGQVLRGGKFLTRDPRMKERKKYGLHGARRGQQYSKR